MFERSDEDVMLRRLRRVVAMNVWVTTPERKPGPMVGAVLRNGLLVLLGAGLFLLVVAWLVMR